MTRARLPARRASETFVMTHGEIAFSIGVGLYDDGSPGEVFIHALDKSAKGSAVEALARDAAILISIARQYGAPLDGMRRGVTRDDKGAPATLVGAVLDAVCGAEGV